MTSRTISKKAPGPEGRKHPAHGKRRFCNSHECPRAFPSHRSCRVCVSAAFHSRQGVFKYEKSPLQFVLNDNGLLVEHRGFEPLTSTLRTLRATNCANAPYSLGVADAAASTDNGYNSTTVSKLQAFFSLFPCGIRSALIPGRPGRRPLPCRAAEPIPCGRPAPERPSRPRRYCAAQRRCARCRARRSAAFPRPRA